MAVLEAAALQLPIVATAVGDVPYLIEDGVTGRLVPPGDPAALARAIDHVLGQPDRALSLGASAADRVRTRFSALESARQACDLYWHVLARTPAPRAAEAQPNE